MVIAVNDSVIHMGLARVRKLLQEDSNDRCGSERLCGTLTEAFPGKGNKKSTKPRFPGKGDQLPDSYILTFLGGR